MFDAQTIAKTCIENLNQLQIEEENKTRPLYAQVKAIESEYGNKRYAQQDILDKLKSKYLRTAIDVADAHHSCPCERWGSPMKPRYSKVTAEGIDLTWEHYGVTRDTYDYYSASWSEILEMYNKKTNDDDDNNEDEE